MTKAHHTAICTNDVDESLRFWRDGLGFEVTALARLSTLRLGGDPRRISVHGVEMAVVRDPDGVRVELIDLPPER